MKSMRIFVLVLLIFALPVNAYAAERRSCSCEEYPDLYLATPYIRSETVSELQGALASLGYYRGEFSGAFDHPTMEAVSLFQKENGLGIDGKVKYHTWLRLAKRIEDKLVIKKEKLTRPDGEVSIVIDTFRKTLTVFNNALPYAQFPVAIGKPSTPSPLGSWKIVNKSVNWGTGFGTRWMELSVPWGIYGIHGTNKPGSIGSMASHGCFRMFNQHAETIYPWVKVGTSVTVIGNPFGYMAGGYKPLVVGSRNPSVTYVQEKLARLGFYKGNADGIYGNGTARSVRDFQKQFKLKTTGQVNYAEYKALGLRTR